MTPAGSNSRIASIDAFRGFTMFCMFTNGFGLNYFAANPWVAPLARQFDHADQHHLSRIGPVPEFAD